MPSSSNKRFSFHFLFFFVFVCRNALQQLHNNGLRHRAPDATRKHIYLPWRVHEFAMWNHAQSCVAEHATASSAHHRNNVEQFAAVRFGWIDSWGATPSSTCHTKISHGARNTRTYSGRSLQCCIHWIAKIAANTAARQEIIKNRNTQIGYLLYCLLESCAGDLIFFFFVSRGSSRVSFVFCYCLNTQISSSFLLYNI